MAQFGTYAVIGGAVITTSFCFEKSSVLGLENLFPRGFWPFQKFDTFVDGGKMQNQLKVWRPVGGKIGSLLERTKTSTKKNLESKARLG